MAKKKERKLTTILQGIGDETIGGTDTPNKEQVARNFWTLATQGKVTFPDGRELKASVRDWKDTVQWLYNHIDGPVKIDLIDSEGYSKVFEDTPIAELEAIVRGSMLDNGGENEVDNEE